MFETSRKQKEKRILNLHNEGYSIRNIAEQVSKNTCHSEILGL